MCSRAFDDPTTLSSLLVFLSQQLQIKHTVTEAEIQKLKTKVNLVNLVNLWNRNSPF